MSDWKAIRSQAVQIAASVLKVCLYDNGEATETASQRGSDTCSTKTASEIEMVL